MMNWLVKWGVKKWLLSAVNTALDNYRDNVEVARSVVARYIRKVECLMTFLKHLDGALADGKLTDEETDALVARAKETASGLVS